MRSRGNRTKKSGKGQASKSAKQSRGAGRPAPDSGQIIVLSERDDNQTLQPCRIPLLPLRSDVVFPQTVVPLVINRPSGIRLIDDCMIGERMIGLVSQLHPETDSPGMNDLYPMVCVGLILKMLKFPDGSTRIVCQGQYRARLTSVVQTEPYLVGQIEPCEEVVESGVELDALVHHVNRFFQRMVDQSQQIPEELQVAAINTREPGRLADLLASSLPFTIEEKQALLGEIDVRARLERLGQYLSRQLAVLELSTKIQEQVGSELSKAQRDHFLRQQLKAIQDELGENENENPEIGELWERIKKANPPLEVQNEAERELERLAAVSHRHSQNRVDCSGAERRPPHDAREQVVEVRAGIRISSRSARTLLPRADLRELFFECARPVDGARVHPFHTSQNGRGGPSLNAPMSAAAEPRAWATAR